MNEVERENERGAENKCIKVLEEIRKSGEHIPMKRWKTILISFS